MSDDKERKDEAEEKRDRWNFEQREDVHPTFLTLEQKDMFPELTYHQLSGSPDRRRKKVSQAKVIEELEVAAHEFR
jgi:hypothetical protein